MSLVQIKKYQYIDALRGIAILMVIMVHTTQQVMPPNRFLSNLMLNGDKGVQLFYLISALTLCFSLESRKKKESKPVLYFFIRRFFRIAPLFYLAIIFYQYPFDMQGNYYAPNGIKGWYFIAAATFTHGWHPETINSVVPGSWSLAVEFSFYLFLPLLFRLINNKEKAVVFLIFTCVINYFISKEIYESWAGIYSNNQDYLAWGVAYHGFFNQLPVFAVGLLLFHTFKENIFNHSWKTSFAFLFLSTIMMFAFTEYCAYLNIINQLTIFAVAFALLTYALANYGFLLFVNRVTGYIGKISYSMYLVHFALIKYFIGFDFFGLSGLKTGGTFIALGIVIICTILVSTITYYLVEKTCITLGNRIIQKIENKAVLS